MTFGIGLTTYFAASQSFHNYPPLLLATIFSGAILLIALGITLIIFTSINNSRKFSRWLSEKKSIIRKHN